jgi:LysM repeat protein
MEKEEIQEQGSTGTSGWSGFVWGCALSTPILCSLILAMLLIMSVVLNGYLAWTMSGYKVILNKPTAVPTLVVLVTPTGGLVLSPTPTPTVMSDSVPLPTSPASPTSMPTSTPTAVPTNANTPISTQPTPEPQCATPTATATHVAAMEDEGPEATGMAGGSVMPVSLETSQVGSGPTSKVITYVVQTDDTLWLIADREYSSGSLWELIFEANRDILIDPDRIQPGQVLTIPVAP